MCMVVLGTMAHLSGVCGLVITTKKNGIAQPFGEVTGFTPDVRSPLPLLGLGLVVPGTTLTSLTITTIVRDERVGCSIAY